MGFNLFDLLLPRETKFFKYMEQQVEYLVKGCTTFKDLVSKIETLSEDAIKKELLVIKDCESSGDAVERTIIEELHKTFITPIDREDIHTLAINVDRALDILNSISRKIEIYNIRQVPANVWKFADIIVKISLKMGEVVSTLKTHKSIEELVRDMHSLENEADELFHVSMAELFNEKDPIHIIKFKEMYEHLESVVDAIDYVGKLIRGIKVKQG
jgi:predicted phosphate transport protein (TIGR00153 family)